MTTTTEMNGTDCNQNSQYKGSNQDYLICTNLSTVNSFLLPNNLNNHTADFTLWNSSVLVNVAIPKRSQRPPNLNIDS